jgi:hypothetical protein
LLQSRDVLPVLASLSGLWQARELDVTALARDLPITIATLQDLIERPGPNFLQLTDFIAKVEEGGHTVRVEAGRNEAWLEQHRKKWLRSLVDHLNMYFPNMPLMLAVYNLLNPQAVPTKCSSDEFMNHGMGDLALVCAHFCVSRGGQGPVIDQQDLLDGWPRMKSVLRACKDKKVWEDVKEPVQDDKVIDVFSEDAYRHSTTTTRRQFTTTKKHRLITIAEVCADFVVGHAHSSVAVDRAWVHLCMIYLVWILATAECERGFSLLNSIKTALRNRLVHVCGTSLFKHTHVLFRGMTF